MLKLFNTNFTKSVVKTYFVNALTSKLLGGKLARTQKAMNEPTYKPITDNKIGNGGAIIINLKFLKLQVILLYMSDKFSLPDRFP